MVTKTAAKQKALLYSHEQTTQKDHWILLLLCMHQYFFYGSPKCEVLTCVSVLKIQVIAVYQRLDRRLYSADQIFCSQIDTTLVAWVIPDWPQNNVMPEQAGKDKNHTYATQIYPKLSSWLPKGLNVREWRVMWLSFERAGRLQRHRQ